MSVRALWREPLLHFILLGAAIFGLSATSNEAEDPAEETAASLRASIVVDDALRERLASDYLRVHGAPPSDTELDTAVQTWVVEEALYREALLLGLDRGDEIVRRRLIQKMRFITDGVAAVDEPTDAELEEYLAANSEDYAVQARFAFEHVYFATGRRGEAAEEDCRAFLATVGADGADVEPTGDPHVHGRVFANHGLDEIGARFGRTFVEELGAAPPGRWYGPVRSSTGYHAVVVHSTVQARSARLDEVRDRVASDWRDDRRRERSAAAIETLVAAYGAGERSHP